MREELLKENVSLYHPERSQGSLQKCGWHCAVAQNRTPHRMGTGNLFRGKSAPVQVIFRGTASRKSIKVRLSSRRFLTRSRLPTLGAHHGASVGVDQASTRFLPSKPDWKSEMTFAA